MTIDTKKVFVIYGRNDVVRREMFAFLRAIGLSPIEWSQAVALTGVGTPFIGEVLNAAFNVVQAVVVLLTGDDEARLRSDYQSEDDPDYEKQLTPQARPNVLFEAGMAFGTQPNRTILVELGRLRPFSDVSGRHTIRLNNKPERRMELVQRLRSAGCAVDLTGNDWVFTGNFNI